MANGNAIVGRKVLSETDFYETPRWATRKAVEAMLIDGVINRHDEIYDPCCGAGAITDVLYENNFENIRASDIQTETYIKGEKGIDVYNINDKFVLLPISLVFSSNIFSILL